MLIILTVQYVKSHEAEREKYCCSISDINSKYNSLSQSFSLHFMQLISSEAIVTQVQDMLADA